MIEFNVYPEGKRRIVTFSYDDGDKRDAKLIEIFNKYNVKATFHINGWRYKNADEETVLNARKLYSGHEISCHTLLHGFLNQMNDSVIINQVSEDRKILENLAGYPVTGMSYPSGDYDERVENVLKCCGIVYSRTTGKCKNEFEIPYNFLEWHPTCHHKNAFPVAESFLSQLDSQWCRPLLYIWGHSHELNTEYDFEYMEKLVSMLANNSKIWYATNIEIYRYITAQKNLVISADEKIIYNPSAIPVWVCKNKREIIKINAGETVVSE